MGWRGTSSAVLLLTTAAASWYAMMVVHESGHVLGAWLSGGRVAGVVLHPMAFSRTDLAANPHPLFVVWAGPAWGVAAPLLAWLAARAMKFELAYLLRAFCGFCGVANGAYLTSAGFMPLGDAADMVRLGSPAWLVVAVGVASLAGGLALWNGLGPSFGLGPDRTVERRAIVATSACLAALVLAMLAWSWLV